ncbi:gene transfer agent family protein [Ensifer sp. ENS01]|uniref:gene transfer agent family protein n=1 Tax=Ensifer sp. ENS01 TaxID=2769293 RepID=UPI001AED283D|nr:gene transfer agent family protein [Ensifer sp. ENS01]
MQHTAFFGDGEKTFALTSEMIHELERTTGVGIMALHTRFRAMAAHFGDLIEVIRTGLIGGGTSPEEAHKLVGIYSRSMQVSDLYHLAFDILDARYLGKPEVTEADAINDALQRVAE